MRPMPKLTMTARGRGWVEILAPDGHRFNIARSGYDGPRGGHRSGWEIAWWDGRDFILCHRDSPAPDGVFDTLKAARAALAAVYKL